MSEGWRNAVHQILEAQGIALKIPQCELISHDAHLFTTLSVMLEGYCAE